MLAALHVWTHARAEARFTLEVNVVPQTGSLAVTPVAVRAVVDVAEGKRKHKRSVLQKPGLGVFYEPDQRVEVVDDLLTPENQGVGKR